MTYEITRPFAKAVAELIERQHPESVVSAMSKELREERCSSVEPELTA